VKAEDRIGQVFGRLTVVSVVGKNKYNQTVLGCKCACGSMSEHALGNLRGGHATSCGCLKKELLSRMSSTHNKTSSNEYCCWATVVQRCTNPNHAAYHYYGGRGIAVCDEWLSFENFYRDMGDKPSSYHTLDRIDNDGPYCKENCRWATKKEQANNRRSNVRITLYGKTQTLAQWSREFGLSHRTIGCRLKRGWSVEDALTKPSGGHNASNQ